MYLILQHLRKQQIHWQEMEQMECWPYLNEYIFFDVVTQKIPATHIQICFGVYTHFTYVFQLSSVRSSYFFITRNKHTYYFNTSIKQTKL